MRLTRKRVIMKKLHISAPISCGIFLTYKCTGSCRHCMYASAPGWDADWLSFEHAKLIFEQLAGKIQAAPYGENEIGINYGIHFTGGEPFLNFDRLLELITLAKKYRMPSMFVETNCFWCTDDTTTRKKLKKLKQNGLHGILISVNPFILEYVPFARTERAIRISQQIFHRNVIVYQDFFYHLFQRFELKETLPLEAFMHKAPDSFHYVELLPMGRAVYALSSFHRKYPARAFFGTSCREELTREWHVHIDNYCNYLPGYCGGTTLGDARMLDSLLQGIDLDEHPILDAIVTDLGMLYDIATRDFSYKELNDGYISKCHLCLDMRKHIAGQTDEFKELQPRTFYTHL